MVIFFNVANQVSAPPAPTNMALTSLQHAQLNDLGQSPLFDMSRDATTRIEEINTVYERARIIAKIFSEIGYHAASIDVIWHTGKISQRMISRRFHENIGIFIPILFRWSTVQRSLFSSSITTWHAEHFYPTSKVVQSYSLCSKRWLISILCMMSIRFGCTTRNTRIYSAVYLLTEVAHGVDARQIETTATMLPTGEFDFHTPNPGACK